MQADPVSGDTMNPEGWNRYTYSINDPVNLMDPSGLDWFADWISPANSNWFASGAALTSWISNQEDRAFFGYYYWDLPGNASDAEQMYWVYVHAMLPKGRDADERVWYDPAANSSDPCDLSGIAIPEGVDVNRNIQIAMNQASIASANERAGNPQVGLLLWFENQVRNAKGRVNDVKSGASGTTSNLALSTPTSAISTTAQPEGP